MLRVIVPVIAGATIGGLMGAAGKCSDGACPLTATWYRGALFGAVVGALASLG